MSRKFGAIVRTEDNATHNLVRYFMVGEMTNEGFTGALYDYVGGGEHQEVYSIKGELDWEMDEELFIEKSKFMGQEFIDDMTKFYDKDISFSPDSYKYETDIVGTKYTGFKLTPVEIGNTIWEEN